MTIRKAKYIKSKLEVKPNGKDQKKEWLFLYGVYQSRFLGLCIYRQPSKAFKQYES